MESFRPIVATFCASMIACSIWIGYVAGALTLTNIGDAVAFALVTAMAGVLVWGFLPSFRRLVQPNHQFDLLQATNLQDIRKVLPFLSFLSKIGNLDQYEDAKLQVVKVTAHEHTLEDCRASITIDGTFSDYLLWDDGSEKSTLRRGEHDYVPIWFGYKLREQPQGQVWLNTSSKVSLPIGTRDLDILLRFVGEENYERMFHFTLRLDTWESLGLQPMRSKR